MSVKEAVSAIADAVKEFIRPRLGPGVLRRHYEGKSLLKCLKEIAKNARDWGASRFWITTADAFIRFVDNGRGQGRANREAFSSFNLSTATDERQSGQFGSGAKFLLYSFARLVEVLTAPEEEPDYVYRFRFTPDELEKLAIGGGQFPAERLPKTRETWTYEHRFGSEFTYHWKDPKSSKLRRDLAMLPELLASALPMKFEQIVFVNGAALPPKQVVGGVYAMSVQHPQLGLVTLEVFRPAKWTRETDSILFGSHEMGEIPVADFVRNLGDLSPRFPQVLLERGVSGVIIAEYIAEHVNEDRVSVKPAIADDPRTHYLVRFLEDCQDDVAARLELKPQNADGDATEEIEEVLDLFNRKFGPGKKEGPVCPPPDDVDVPDPDPGKRRRPNAALFIDSKGEYEAGEKVSLIAHLSPALAKRYAVKDIVWDTAQSGCVSVSQTADGIQMVADRIGVGIVVATLSGTNIREVVKFRIVRERVFRLSIPQMTVTQGAAVPVMTWNSDKLHGEVVWEFRGDGKLEPDGARAIFKATKVGEATIIARDSKSKKRAEGRVTILPDMIVPPLRTIRIRDVEFDVYDSAIAPGGGTEAFVRPVHMVRMGPVRHRMTVNTKAPGFEAALKKGLLGSFLTNAIALEFARFLHFDLQEELKDATARDLPVLTDTVHAEAYQLYEEILVAMQEVTAA